MQRCGGRYARVSARELCGIERVDRWMRLGASWGGWDHAEVMLGWWGTL